MFFEDEIEEVPTSGYHAFSFQAMPPGVIPVFVFRGSISDNQWDPESPQVVDNVVLQCLALYC